MKNQLDQLMTCVLNISIAYSVINADVVEGSEKAFPINESNVS